MQPLDVTNKPPACTTSSVILTYKFIYALELIVSNVNSVFGNTETKISAT